MTAVELSGGFPRLRPPTYRSLIFAGALIGLSVLLFAAGGPLTPFLLGLMVVAVLNPVVDRLTAWGLARGVATILVILAVLAIVGVLVWLVVDTVVEQARALVTGWPELSESLQGWLSASSLPPSVIEPIEAFVADLPSAISAIAPRVVETILIAAGTGVVALISIASLPFFIYYVLTDRAALRSGAYQLMPREYVATARDIFAIASRVFSAWGRSLLLLSTSIGVPVFVGFLLLGVFVDPFFGDVALLFGVIAFFTEFVPIVGGYLAMIPAVIIALAGTGPLGALLTALLFAGAQFFEGSILVPRIQGTALKLPAAVVLLALVIGAAVGGFIGVLLALPVTATLRAVLDYLYERAAGAAPGLESEGPAETTTEPRFAGPPVTASPEHP